MTDLVLDASALLALLMDEPGGRTIEAGLRAARISAVNLAEAAQRLQEQWSDEAVIGVLMELPCRVIDFDRALALRAGLMRRATRSRGLSLGDRACLALGEALGLPVLTADRAWADLDLGVEVVLIR
jgi:ribonuclease VapC